MLFAMGVCPNHFGQGSKSFEMGGSLGNESHSYSKFQGPKLISMCGRG
jgi:hypothetical protein